MATSRTSGNQLKGHAYDSLKSSGYEVAFLAYWLSQYVLLTDPQDDKNLYIFPMAILITKMVQLALALLNLRSLCA